MRTRGSKPLQIYGEHLDRIVKLAEKCVKETKIADSKMEESQLHNLRNLANATDSVRALENFISYQIGRRSEWHHNGFGRRVLDDLGKLSDMAEEIAQQGDVSKRAVHLELIRLYTGFLYRAFVAERPRSS